MSLRLDEEAGQLLFAAGPATSCSGREEKSDDDDDDITMVVVEMR